MPAEVGNAYITIFPKPSKNSTKIMRDGMQKAVGGIGDIGGELTKKLAIGNIVGSAVMKGVDMLTASLGSAVNRVDTLRNYPKVMSGLGVSAEDAASSIDYMSDRLSNLPTRLDAMAASTQSLYTAGKAMGMSLGDATKAGLGLNDMLLAGGQGSAVAEAAMVQFTQAVAKGKPDMQDWKSVVMAAPAQVDQLAKSMLGAAANSNDLYEALKSGRISMADMMNEIIRLDEQGGEGFDSFAKQAEGATGGIATAMANAQNAVTKGLANVLDAIGQDTIAGAFEGMRQGVSSAFAGVVDAIDGFKDEFDLSALQEAWEAFVKSFDAGLGDMASAADVGRTVAQVLNALVDVFRAIGPFVAPVLAAGAAITVVTSAISAASTAITAITTVIGTLKAALGMVSSVQALGAAFVTLAGGPVTLIIAGVAALVGALIWLWNTNEGFRNAVTDAVNFLGSLITGWIDMNIAAWQALGSFLTGLWSAISSTATAAWSGIVSFVSGIPGKISSIFSGLVGLMSGIWDGVKQAGINGFNALVDGVRSIPGQIVDFFWQIPGAIEGIFASIHVPTLHVEGGFNLDPANFSLPTISFYAMGGIVKQAAIMGESGAEAIVPYTNSNIRPWAAALADAAFGDKLRQSDSAMAEAVVRWLDANLGPTIAEYAPTATPREFGRMVRRYV